MKARVVSGANQRPFCITQRDKSLKDLNTKLANLNKNLSENQMLINYLKRELE